MPRVQADKPAVQAQAVPRAQVDRLAAQAQAVLRVQAGNTAAQALSSLIRMIAVFSVAFLPVFMEFGGILFR